MLVLFFFYFGACAKWSLRTNPECKFWHAFFSCKPLNDMHMKDVHHLNRTILTISLRARGETVCDCDGNNTFHLPRYQINVNLCPLTLPFSCNVLHPDLFLSCLAHYWLHLLNSAFLSDALGDRLSSWKFQQLHREGGKRATADEIWAVITLTITCQTHCFNLRVHQFSEEEIKGEEEKQSR